MPMPGQTMTVDSGGAEVDAAMIAVIPCHPRESGEQAGIRTRGRFFATLHDTSPDYVQSSANGLFQSVIPAKAGIQGSSIEVDSRFRGNDGE